MDLQQGDLVYIPQDVYVYSTSAGKRFRTTKPITALFIEDKKESFVLQVLIDGVTMNVRRNHVYPLKEEIC